MTFFWNKRYFGVSRRTQRSGGGFGPAYAIPGGFRWTHLTSDISVCEKGESESLSPTSTASAGIYPVYKVIRDERSQRSWEEDERRARDVS